MIHQLVHTLNYGDAISGEALSLQRVFRARGIESEIYAINTHPKYKGLTKDYRDFNRGFMGEVILHYSLGSPLNELYRNLPLAKRAIIYHNLTPSKWFAGVNPRIVSDIEEGLAELPDLLKISDKVVADSKFNAHELKQYGTDAAVLGLPFDPVRWDIPRNEGFYNLLKNEGGIHILHVGRIAPNKCLEDLIKAFYFLHHKIDKRSRLWLPGIDIDTELYSFSLKRMVHEFQLTGVVEFCGGRSDDELKALYEASSAYVCLSEHEGFCLPVIEAMNFNLPVIGYNATALPETIASGGILVNDKDPHKLAELMYQVATDDKLRIALVEKGLERVKDFTLKNFTDQVDLLF